MFIFKLKSCFRYQPNHNGKKVVIGYFAEFGVLKGGSSIVGFQFNGGIYIPREAVPAHIYNKLKDKIFEKLNLSSIHTDKELRMKASSFKNVTFGGDDSA